MNKKNDFSPSKVALFSVIPLLLILLIAELGARVAIYQRRSAHSLALVEVYDKIGHRVRSAIAEYQVGTMALPKGIRTALYEESGTDLLAEFQGRYEDHFAKFVEEVAEAGSRLLVVYIPSDDFYGKRTEMDSNRAFFADLARKYEVDFLDVSERFLEYPANVVTLLPADNHLSRFGNKIVSKEIGTVLETRFADARSNVTFEERPELFGDFRPNEDSVWTLVPSLPYHVVTNSQGLRMDYDLEFPKDRQRALALGDSVTFGVFVHNHDTYPALIGQHFPQFEVVNAGVQGYTIFQQRSLFNERAKFVEPDITILQVLDNDLYDFFYFRLNVFDRTKGTHKPSELETQFLEFLRNSG